MEFIRKLNLYLSALLVLLLLSPRPAISEQDSQTAVHLYTAFNGSPFHFDTRIRRYAGGVWHNHPEIIPTIQKAKAAYPEFKAFMYRELFCVLEKETPHHESIGNFENLPDAWFQKDVRGRRVEVPDYPGRWVMDVGNSEFQDFWIQKTLKDVKENNWDGVFADDALTQISAHDLPPLQGYPDDESFQQAFYNFLKKITLAFHAEGKLVVANASNTYDYPGLWEKWLEVTDGLAEEHFTGDGWTWGDHVAERQMEAMRTADQKGKLAFVMTYRKVHDPKRIKDSLAAYLVAAGEHTYWSSRPSNVNGLNPFEDDQESWDLASNLHLGKSLEAPSQEGSVWVRKFENGWALINTGQSSEDVNTPKGKITLQPLSGEILDFSQKTTPS